MLAYFLYLKIFNQNVGELIYEAKLNDVNLIMLMIMERKEVIVRLRRALENHKSVVFAYLYGSFAREQEHPFSDIDVAVFLRENTLEAYMDLLSKLPELGRDIDLRVLNNAPPLFGYKVIKEGKVLVNKKPELLQKFIYEILVEALEIKDEIANLRRKRIERMLNAH